MNYLIYILFFLSACSLPAHPPQGDNAEEDTPQTVDATPTPEPEESPSPTPALWQDQLGSYQVRGVTCQLDLAADSASYGELVASGEATVTAETQDVLCAWGGSQRMPFYDYSCLPGMLQIPAPGEWFPFRLETGYDPEGRGNDPADLRYVLCAAGEDDEAVCYL